MSKYAEKLATAEQVAALVKDGMWVDFGGVQMPRAFDRALAQRAGELKNVKVRMIGHLTPLEIMKADPEGKSFWTGNWHILGHTRTYIAQNRGTHIPYNFGETARYYEDSLDVDIAVQIVTPMDKHGYFNFGPLCNFKKAVFHKAKTSRRGGRGGYALVLRRL